MRSKTAESNAGAMPSEHARPRGGARHIFIHKNRSPLVGQTNFCDDKSLVAGDSPAPDIIKPLMHLTYIHSGERISEVVFAAAKMEVAVKQGQNQQGKRKLCREEKIETS